MKDHGDSSLSYFKNEKCYTNSYTRDKFFDGIDRTIRQNFREKEVKIQDKNALNNIIWYLDEKTLKIQQSLAHKIYDYRSNEIQRKNKFWKLFEDDCHKNNYYHNKCDCCGKKIKENSFEPHVWDLCIHCFVRMCYKTKAQKRFPDLWEGVTSVPNDLISTCKIDKNPKLKIPKRKIIPRITRILFPSRNFSSNSNIELIPENLVTRI